jgi:hypothetical protein
VAFRGNVSVSEVIKSKDESYTKNKNPQNNINAPIRAKNIKKGKAKGTPNGAKMHDPTKFPGQGGWAKKISGRISALRRLIRPP